jgi:cytochrome c-type biogenesis protein CcmE
MVTKKQRKVLAGGAVVLAALAYLVVGGMKQAVVYFQTPSEIRQNPKDLQGKSLRIGGQVVSGSLKVDKAKLHYAFDLTDGVEKVPVQFHGIPPDLFREGQGAVVEGRLSPDGTLLAATILAKHAEEYSPAEPGSRPARSFVPAEEKKPL